MSKEKGEKKVTRRQFLKDLGLFAIAGVALSKLDFLAGEIIKRTGEGNARLMDWNCPSIYTPTSCGLISTYHCSSGYYCSTNVTCTLNFQCYIGNDNAYGCTTRTFTCYEGFTCQQFNCTPQTFECSGGSGPGWFQCTQAYNPNYD